MNNNTFFMKLKHTKVATLAATLITFGSLAGGANGAIIFSQAGNDITMEITNESYTLTTDYTGSWAGIAVFDVFSTPGSSLAGSVVSASLSYTINGGAPTVASNWTGWQYRPGTQGVYDSNDAAFLIGLPSGTWSTGDTITVNGTLVMNSLSDPDIVLPDLVSPTSQTGLTGQFGQAISATHAITAVPEPSSALLLGLGALGMVARRKRKS